MRPLRIFIIQPFQASHSESFKKIIDEVCKESKGKFIAFRADDEFASVGSRLQDRIDSYIKKSDICIADLCLDIESGKRSENALLEVGAAYTLNIPVILAADSDLPADIKGNLYLKMMPKEFKTDNYINEFKSKLRNRFHEASLEIGFHRRNQFIAYGFNSRRSVDFSSFTRRCQKRISILTTNLGFVVNERLKHGLDEEVTLLQMIASMLTEKPSGFTIRILALDPDSNFTNDRASDLNRDRKEFREKMRQDLETVINFAKSNDCVRSLQIKTYETSALQMTYFFDDYVISSVVSKSVSSRECITYIHSLHVDGARQTYEHHFDNLWGSAKLVASSKSADDRISTWNTD